MIDCVCVCVCVGYTFVGVQGGGAVLYLLQVQAWWVAIANEAVKEAWHHLGYHVVQIAHDHQ